MSQNGFILQTHTFYLVVLLLFAGIPFSSAEARVPFPPWRVGQWAAYMLDTDEGDHQLIELGIVGKERVNGRTFFWCEMIGEEHGTKIVIKQLFDPMTRELANVYVQKGDKAPIALRPGSWVRFDSGVGFKTFFPKEAQGQRTSPPKPIHVYAGRYVAMRSHQGKSHSWWSRRVPISGLVQALVKDSGKIQLIASGPHGAVPRLRGKPRLIGPMPGILHGR